MPALWVRGLVAAALATALAATFATNASAAADLVSVTPGELLVVGRFDSTPGGAVQPLSSTSPPSGVLDVARARAVRARRAEPVSRSAALGRAFPGGAWVLYLEEGEDLEACADRLAQDPAILYAGPNHVIPIGPEPESGAVSASPRASDVVPDDEYFDSQYALTATRVPEAWETTSGAGVRIAVIDTGVDTDHPDLLGQIAVNVPERDGSPGVDDDGNGYVDDVFGYDFTDAPSLPGVGDYLGRDADPEDDVGHGTEVSGVICAIRNNGIGIAGVAPDARVIPVRAGLRTTFPSLSAVLQEDDVAAAIMYAVDRGADILNLSFGDVLDSPLIRVAVEYARDQGAIVIVSAGNTSQDQAYFPAAYPGAFSVGATDRYDDRAAFSTFGQDLDLLAPGVSLLTTTVGGGYRTSSGTSFSAPMVAGVAALIRSVHPEWPADQVLWQLRLTARGASKGWNPEAGWGLVDAESALGETGLLPVVQVAAVSAGAADYNVEGTVAHPGLVSWSLFMAPEDDAVAGDFSAEIPLVERMTRQIVDGTLASFNPPAAETAWVLRLVATVAGWPVIEERTRFVVPAMNLTSMGVGVEVQVGRTGHDLVASWSSSERHQGALRFVGDRGLTRFASEPAISTNHGVRIEGPLPVGIWTAEILARSDDRQPFAVLRTVPVFVPAPETPYTTTVGSGLPPGIPMPKIMNWDMDSLFDILVEAPPPDGTYGEIKRYELLADGSAVERNTSDGLFQGIPVDAADADGDGNQELVVYRVDGWSVWEASGTIFPNTRIHSEPPSQSIPMGYVDTGNGILLLVVSGQDLRAYRSDPAAGYVLASSATADANLLKGMVVRDFDADGRPEAVFANDAGGLSVFDITPQAVSLQATVTAPFQLAGPVAAVVVLGGFHLITLEQDPMNPQVGGDIDRAALRVRRWRPEGEGFVPMASLAFAGLHRARDLQLLIFSNNVLLRRGPAVDLVLSAANDLRWGGRVFVSALPSVGGAAIQTISTTQGPMLWIGSPSPGAAGDQIYFDETGLTKVGSGLYTREAVSMAGVGVRVVLEWEPDACAGIDSLVRSGDVRGSHEVAVGSRTAVDTVAFGERVEYFLRAGSCPERVLAVRGRDLAAPVARWESGRIVLDLEAPLRAGPTGTPALPLEVLLSAGGAIESPRSVHLHGEGAGLLIVPPSEPPDSVIIVGAWDVDGLPVGGSVRAAIPVPPAPLGSSLPVLARVRYRYPQTGPFLEVDLEGDAPACSTYFELQPMGWDLATLPVPGSSATLELQEPLFPGTYTLQLRGDCLPPPETTLGLERSFTVGLRMYPNPLGPGDRLVLDNVEPGTRVEVHDVAGALRVAWEVSVLPDERDLPELAPGLYFVRIVGANGSLVAIEKLVVLR